MSVYTPDNWIILKMDLDGETTYKVLAGWSGGYLDGSNWKLNSGVTRATMDDTHYYFYGHSGSVYKCHKESEMVRMNIAGVLNSWLTKFPNNIRQVSAVEMLKEI